MNHSLQITAPCRLHFGLLRFSQAAGLSYGGLGMMVDPPATVVQMQRADTWQATGPHAKRALAFAQQATRTWTDLCESPLSIQVRQTPPAHAGLGSGTQLALAVAHGVRLLGDLPPASAPDLSAAVGRGRRSAIGSHGFFSGGLLWETGRNGDESLTPLTCRLDVPDSWRVLLITPPHDAGLYGSAESDAFANLPPVPAEVTERLQRLAKEKILPAARQADFAAFCESLFHYGHLAGSCFSPVQGGPYASAEVARCIERLRSLGLQGVGQSSWGPTIFAFTQDASSANHWLDKLSTRTEFVAYNILLATPNNHGASVAQLGR